MLDPWSVLKKEIDNRDVVHAMLDKAGIPPAGGAVCNRPDCQTHLQHRVHCLIDERDRLRADLNTAMERIAAASAVIARNAERNKK